MIPFVHDATSATATFLFTDVEGSTQVLKTHRDDYPSILADHHRILRAAFAANGGREVDNQGDSFFVAFARVKDAVLAAATGQRALTEHAWPDRANVRVRMGIHTGEADFTADRYIGMSVHRAARISSVGHGGQVLVSSTTVGLLDDEENLPGVALRNLGEHRLKDIAKPVQLYQLDIQGLRNDFPPLSSEPREPNRRMRAALVAVALVALAAVAVAAVWLSRDGPPPAIVPNSLVRFDPDTLEPTDVFPIGGGADFVLSAGGYVWVTHYILRDADSGELRNSGDRTLTRVDPATGDVVVVGGGLAPCGLTADPSGDIWVANCFASGGKSANVVRVDAASLDFEATWPMPSGKGFIRSLAYGGGSLWVADVFSGAPNPQCCTVMQVDPETGRRHPISIGKLEGAMAWSEGYGDLWITDFPVGDISRLHTPTEDIETVRDVVFCPGNLVVDGDTVWVGDWCSPTVARVPAVGSGSPQKIALPTPRGRTESSVWGIDAGADVIWAATPRYRSIWRVDPKTSTVTQIATPHLPSGIAADADAVWVSVRDG